MGAKGGGAYFREDTVLTVATINFSLAGVQLLINGGSYSRATFILFGAVPLGDIDTCMIDLIFRIDFQDMIENKQQNQAKYTMFLPQSNDCFRLMIMATPT